jgi:hypothetical protein
MKRNTFRNLGVSPRQFNGESKTRGFPAFFAICPGKEFINIQSLQLPPAGIVRYNFVSVFVSAVD